MSKNESWVTGWLTKRKEARKEHQKEKEQHYNWQQASPMFEGKGRRRDHVDQVAERRMMKEERCGDDVGASEVSVIEIGYERRRMKKKTMANVISLDISHQY